MPTLGISQLTSHIRPVFCHASFSSQIGSIIFCAFYSRTVFLLSIFLYIYTVESEKIVGLATHVNLKWTFYSRLLRPLGGTAFSTISIFSCQFWRLQKLIELNLKHFGFVLAETACFIAPKVWLWPCQRRQQRAQQQNEWSEAKAAQRSLGRGQQRRLGHLGQPIYRLGDVGGNAKKGDNVDTVGMGRSRD